MFLVDLFKIVSIGSNFDEINKKYDFDEENDTPVEKIKARQEKMKYKEKEEQKELKKYDNINDQVLDKAEKYVPDKCDIDDSVRNKILSKNYPLIKSTKMLNRAEETQRWINYALYFMQYNSAPKLIHISRSTKELLNAISNRLGYFKIYEDENIANLHIYDCMNDETFGSDPEFILSLEKLDKYNTMEFQSNIYKRKQSMGINKTAPIHFTEPNEANTLYA